MSFQIKKRDEQYFLTNSNGNSDIVFKFLSINSEWKFQLNNFRQSIADGLLLGSSSKHAVIQAPISGSGSDGK